MRYVVAATDLDQGLPSLAPRYRLRTLMGRELELAAEPNAPRLRPLAPLVGSGSDQVPLEGRKAGEHGDHKLARGGARVTPWIS